ncbi:hypothetical protein ACHAPC_003286 [Botrytis cinerea]|uniref:Uncharacterized protein n=1 Tax=Botryotinia fuckeliana (strain BcDW1) TaxID=1290391 RepID=M7TFW7_BOTF1|nr:hypothetical protein BcDW1_9000 [Botrytis cinerea BcDW1]
MPRVLLTLCSLSQEIFRLLERVHELHEKILDKDDVIHDWERRAEQVEGRLVRELAEKDATIVGHEAEIAALKAELAAVRAGQQAKLGEGRRPRKRQRRIRK